MIEGDLLPLAAQVIHHRPEYSTCYVNPIKHWHVLGASPCITSTGCRTHYGLCLPVSTHLLDHSSLLGVLDLDLKAIEEIIKNKRTSESPSLSVSFPSVSSSKIPTSKSPSPSNTVAELAAPKRAGRLPGGPDASSVTTNRKSGHRSPASNLFSLELMQTDDVSTIAAQIANQAELIYQAWKTTDLNPSELIHYHSVSSDRSSLSPSASFHSGPPSPPVSLSPRIPVRNISPAPLGASPAVPRRIIDIPISTDRQSGNTYSKQNEEQTQFSKQFSPQQQLQQHSQHQQYNQPHQSHQQFQHAASPARSLNASPRPYIPPGSGEINPSSPQSPRVVQSSPNSARPFSSRNVSPQPPPPPERSSSYVEPQKSQSQKQKDAKPNADLEASLRELVTNFVMEDKAKLANTKVCDRPKSAPPSSIQDALNKFERQMAITSRVSSENTHSLHTPSSLSFTVAPTTTSNSQASAQQNSRLLTGTTRSELSPCENWNKREFEMRNRRSVSPSPVISQPGWNEPPPSNTSTWPLKNKQSANQDRRVPATSSVVTHPTTQSPKPVSTPSSQPQPTNYITTLEAHVDSQGRSPGVPIRHKVIAMPGASKEEERLLQSLRKSPLVEDKDALRPLDSLSKSHSEVTTSTTSTPTIITSRDSSTGKSKKYSISVTVDVENKVLSPELPSESTLDKNQLQHELGPNQWQSSNRVESLSNIDYAKVRFQDAQQRPKTSQRLEDYKTFSNKASVNGDGRVMQAKSKFEGNEQPYREVPWRTTSTTVSGEIGSTLPEFYRRKLRKMRKLTSPEPVHALAALPHPQLTDQQKAHIRERSQSPTVVLGTSTAVRPFLTQGSVAERVMLFEKAPTELKKATSSIVANTNTAVTAEKRRPAFSTWRDPDEVRTKAQDIVPSPPSPPRTLETNPTPTPPPPLTAFKQTNLKESLAAVSIANKENARPLSSTTNSLGSPPSISPHSSSPIPSSAISSPCSPSSPLGLGGTGLASPIATRAPGRRLPKTPKNILIPRFYYPLGRPMPQSSQEQSLERVEQCFREHGGQITRENMEPLMRACQLPLYWKAPLFIAAGGEKLGHLTEEQFIDYWNRLISSCHDSYSRFIRILNRGLRSYLLPEDFLALIQDVVDTHPGLTFLKEATEFHSRYVHTVIARIYYCVNRSWSGKITIPELRRSNLLQVISYLEEEEDINKITDYFSYEHFYVIYCKFWELDTDHDLFIDRNDLAKHNDRALSDKIIDRIFSGAVTRGRAHKQDRMGYQEFVWFLISEEDKRHPTAIEYWFRCMDLDGDGYLSMYELEYFYEDQLQRMEALGIETLPFTDCLCQMLDMVRPAEHGRISLSDLKKCRMTPVFYDTFFNFDKYLDHEQRDPFASHRLDDEGPEISDWDRYAAVEYELLVAEEGGGDSQDDMLYGDEDELSMGVDNVLDGSDCELGVIGSELGVMSGSGGLKKHANLSATVPNLALDQMEVDDDYSDYADSDDYQY